MTLAPLLPLVAQALDGAPQSHSSVVLAILIGLLAAMVTVSVILTIIEQRRRNRIELDALAQRYHFQQVDDTTTTERIHRYIDILFGPGPKVLRILRQRTRALDFHLVQLKIPLYRVDADGTWDDKLQESQEKLVLFVSDFETPLPSFRVMPNSWALTTVRGKEANVFHTFEPFGYYNYVLAGSGEDHDWVTHALTGEPMHLLRRNKQLTIDSREGFLAFYLQNERPQPPNLPVFIDQCLALSLAIRDRTESYNREPARTSH